MVTSNGWVRAVLIGAGSLSVAVAMVGVFVPVLPTTPFLLVAAACYLRSSARLYKWLHSNRLFGEHLRRYRAGEGLPLGLKIWAISVLWLSLGSSALFAVPVRLVWLRLFLLAVGIGVTAHVLMIKTAPGRGRGTRD